MKEFYNEKKFDELLLLLQEVKQDEIRLLISEPDLHVLEKIQNEIYLEKKNYVDAFENVGTFIKTDNKYYSLSSEELYKRFVEDMRNREEDI